MLLAQVQQAFENLPPEEQGDTGTLIFWILTEVGVYLLLVLIIYYIIIKPQKDRRKQLEEDKKQQSDK